jgi:two-component system response regulator RegA
VIQVVPVWKSLYPFYIQRQIMTTQEMDKPRLLLVDDDETFCSVLKSALAKRNYEVLVATNVMDGIRLAEQNLPEYAVIDLRIGYESGLELVKKLISLDDNTQIVMLTGFASIATAVEAIKLGATHYLTKPANADEIVSALNKNEGDSSVSISENPLSVKRLEWEHLQKVLMQHDGNISAAARALNMHRRTLQRKLDKKPVRE